MNIVYTGLKKTILSDNINNESEYYQNILKINIQ